MSFRAIMTASVLALSLLGVQSCGTSDEQIAQYMLLDFSAQDKFVDGKITFKLQFSTTGPTLWPSHDHELTLYVDGTAVSLPPQAHWSWHVKYDHILPHAPRSAFWHMTPSELRIWLGSGDHTLWFEFGRVKSNVIRLTIPADGPPVFRASEPIGDCWRSALWNR